MSVENSHSLVRLLANHLVKEKGKYPHVLSSLQKTFDLIGSDNISYIDLSNISDIVNVSNISQGDQPALSKPVTNDNLHKQVHVFARTSIVRSSQVAGGTNQFLPGTSANTIGPFVINKR